jgi:hypothetical protein
MYKLLQLSLILGRKFGESAIKANGAAVHDFEDVRVDLGKAMLERRGEL